MEMKFHLVCRVQFGIWFHVDHDIMAGVADFAGRINEVLTWLSHKKTRSETSPSERSHVTITVANHI